MRYLVHPLKNILNRLRWQVAENADDYLITYRHRGAPGDIKQIRASHIKTIGKSYFTFQGSLSEEETLIPFHRVLEIRNTEKDSIRWISRKRNMLTGLHKHNS
jgi:uncharacterized protein (UPF0248 family)